MNRTERNKIKKVDAAILFERKAVLLDKIIYN